ncbi:MAG: ATP-binding protein [Alphaproteobacteria bacterium]
MHLIKLLHTTAFRMALGYLALFGLSSLALMAFLFWTTNGLIARQTDETIQAEITGLAEQYRRNGTAGLRNVVAERSRNQRSSVYLLTTPTGSFLAGNLDGWPQAQTQADGWLDFSFERPVGETTERHVARARHFSLPGDFQLLVGRDVQERVEIGSRVRQSLIWALALTVVLGLLGGVLMSRNMLRRIDAINLASQDIMAGDLSRRVPVKGSGDEMDRLASQLNDMLAQIERLMTAMRQVTDNVAHDLRGPLTRMRSRMEVALMEKSETADYRGTLEASIEDSDRLLNTFNELLKIARAESGSESADMRDLDLSAVVLGAGELYEPVAEEKGLNYRMEIEAGLVARGLEPLLSQAVANLLDNAIKYTPAGGDLNMRLMGGVSGPVLTITDTGPGIPAEARDRVLERFVRLDASRSAAGSGLGLSLVNAVVRLHGAALTLEDNHPGLRVMIRFPAV